MDSSVVQFHDTPDIILNGTLTLYVKDILFNCLYLHFCGKLLFPNSNGPSDSFNTMQRLKELSVSRIRIKDRFYSN